MREQLPPREAPGTGAAAQRLLQCATPKPQRHVGSTTAPPWPSTVAPPTPPRSQVPRSRASAGTRLARRSCAYHERPRRKRLVAHARTHTIQRPTHALRCCSATDVASVTAPWSHRAHLARSLSSAGVNSTRACARRARQQLNKLDHVRACAGGSSLTNGDWRSSCVNLCDGCRAEGTQVMPCSPSPRGHGQPARHARLGSRRHYPPHTL